MIWFIGFMSIIMYRVFEAGRSTNRFSVTRRDWDTDFREKAPVTSFDGEKLFFYILVTLGFAITWPISIPVFGVYLLGKRFAK